MSLLVYIEGSRCVAKGGGVFLAATQLQSGERTKLRMMIGYTMVGSQVRKVFSLLSTAVGIFWKMGTFLCYEMPKRTLKLYIRIQRNVLYLPLRCVSRLYSFVRKYLTWSTPAPKITTPTPTPAPTPSEPETPVLTFLTNGDTSPEKIKEEMNKLVIESVKAVDRMESRKNKLKDQRRKIDSWMIESEKKTEEMFQIAAEEKQMIKVIAAAIQRIKVLKSRREKMDNKFSEGTRKLFINGTASANKVLESKIFIEEFHKLQMEEECRNSGYNNLLETPKADDGGESSSESLNTASCGSGENKVYQLKMKQNAEILQGIETVKEENYALKQRLAATNEKLELVLDSSSSLLDELVKLGLQFAKVNALNKEISELQTQLAQGREMMRAVQTDRDEMKSKLQTLESMIKEEEDFLAYENSFESGFEDTYSSFFNDYVDFKEPLSS